MAGFDPNAGWNTQYGGYQEPLGGELANASRSIAGHNTDFSKWIQNQDNTSFGTGTNPGILGTGQYQIQGQNANQFSLPNYGPDRGMMMNGAAFAGSRGAIQMDPTQQAQFRQMQMGLAQGLQDQINGIGPSVAQEQLKQSQDQNLANTMATMNSARGAGAAGSAYNTAQAGANVRAQAAGQAALLRAQEIQNDQQTLGGVLAAGRGQDIGFQQSQAQFGLQSRQQNDSLVQFYMSQGMDLDKAQLMANMAQQQSNLGYQQLGMQDYEHQRAANVNLLNMVGKFAGGMGMGAGAGDGGSGFGNGYGTPDALGGTSSLGGTAGMGDLMNGFPGMGGGAYS